jgi:DNA-directed RNA polymerase beta' subunit
MTSKTKAAKTTKTARNAKKPDKARTAKPVAKNATVAETAVKESKTDAKKLSQIEAAIAVLAKAGEPMNCKAMVEAMSRQGLWASPGGKTPEATLYASILREINAKGKDARFVKVERGRFALAGKK